MAFEAVIGLEVHAQLKTQTKIFCGCSTVFGAPPNTHVCPVCLGMPGVLPVLNKRVVEFALRMALATHCEIARESRFARKNYFYPDLPKGYQISQYERPLAVNGHLIVEDGESSRRVGINRIHMEEDAGKLIHDTDRPLSRVDLNRAGVPLIEIVSEPDIRSPEEAGAYLRKLRAIVRYLGICDGNLEEGSFRCDANVSIRPKGQQALGIRAEVKNLNSFRHVEKALHHEILRQQEILAEGGEVIQETRLWDPDGGRTRPLRSKEEAHDYRYFPDPHKNPHTNHEPCNPTHQTELPQLPDERKARFVAQYDLPAYDAGVLTGARELADYFEAGVRAHDNPKALSNWIMVSLLGLLNAQGKDIVDAPIPPERLAALIRLIDAGTISGKIAKTVFDEMVASGKPPEAIVKEKGLVQVTDAGEIEAVVERILSDNPVQVEQYRNGKTKIIGFFVGQVMAATRGKANPGIVNDVLKTKLAKE